MCRLVTGHKATALQEVMLPEATRMGGKAVGVCRVSEVVTWESVNLPGVCQQNIRSCHFTILC